MGSDFCGVPFVMPLKRDLLVKSFTVESNCIPWFANWKMFEACVLIKILNEKKFKVL